MRTAEEVRARVRARIEELNKEISQEEVQDIRVRMKRDKELLIWVLEENW